MCGPLMLVLRIFLYFNWVYFLKNVVFEIWSPCRRWNNGSRNSNKNTNNQENVPQRSTKNNLINVPCRWIKTTVTKSTEKWPVVIEHTITIKKRRFTRYKVIASYWPKFPQCQLRYKWLILFSAKRCLVYINVYRG